VPGSGWPSPGRPVRRRQRNSPGSRVQSSVNFEQQYCVDIEAALDSSNFNQALRLLHEMMVAGAKPSAHLCMRVVTGLFLSRQPKPAWRLFTDLCSAGLRFEYRAYHQVIQMLVKAKAPGFALQAFRLLKEDGYKPNLITSCFMISSLTNAARKSNQRHSYGRQAFELWQDLKKAELPLDATALRTGLNACIMYGQMAEAEEIFRQICVSGLDAPDLRTFNLMLKGYARCGDAEKAEVVLQSMQQLQMKPDGWTLSTIVLLYTNAGDLDSAVAAFDRALESGLKDAVAPSCTSMLKACADARDGSMAMDVLRKMEDAGIRTNDVHLSAAVGALMSAGDLQGARGLMQSMTGKGVKLSAAVKNNFIPGAAKLERLELPQALKLLESMEKSDIPANTDTYNILMTACCKEDQPWGAEALFQKMLLRDISPDVYSYTILMGALADQGELQKALDTFAEMESHPDGLEPDMPALNRLASVLVRMGRVEESKAVLDRLDDMCTRVNMVPSPRGYGAVISGYAAKNNITEAVGTLTRYRSLGGIPDEAMYNDVARVCVGNRDWRRALQVVQVMEQRGHEADRAMLVSMIQKLECRMEEEDAMQDSETRPRRIFNEGFERFKFWLGLPNTYYNASWEWEDEEAE